MCVCQILRVIAVLNYYRLLINHTVWRKINAEFALVCFLSV